MNGTRERNVHEPRPLRRLLARRLPRGTLGRLALATVVEHCHGRAGRIRRFVVFAGVGQRRRRSGGPRPVVEERAEDDGVLEPLRFMHGHDLHEIAIGLEAQLRLLPAALSPLRGEPAQRRRETRRRRIARGDEFGQMVDVGQPPLAVFAGNELRPDAELAHERAPHRGKSALVPQRPIAREALDPGRGVVLVRGRYLVGQRLQAPERGGVETEPVGRERRAQAAQIAGRIDRDQHALELLGVDRLEDRRLRQFDAADAPCRQHVLHEAALLVRAHEHGDVRGRERRGAHAHRALARAAHEAGDLRRARLGGLPLRVALDERIFAGRQHPDVERALSHAVPGRHALVDERAADARTGTHGLIVEPVEHEGLRIGAENAVAGLDERCRRTLIDCERIAGARGMTRGQIRVQIRRAKAVDRLLRIADEKERRRRLPALGEDPFEDRELQRIGVLKFVDERSRITRAQRFGQPRVRNECIVQVREQIVERAHAARALHRAQRGRRFVEPLCQQHEPAHAVRSLGRFARGRERLRQHEKRMLGRRAFHLRRLRECGSGQLERGARRRRVAISLREVAVPGIERRGHCLGLVGRARKHRLGLPEQLYDRLALGMPQCAGFVEARLRIDLVGPAPRLRETKRPPLPSAPVQAAS